MPAAKAPKAMPEIKDPPPDVEMRAEAAEDRAEPVKQPTKDQMAAAATLEDDAAVRPVIVKLARIMAELPELKPEGENKHFNYRFIKDTQISGALRSRLARERIMIISDVVEESSIEIPTKSGKSNLTKLKVLFTAIDGDSGDSVSGHGFGYGDDAGDKGANKAFTAAMKYWLIKLFQIGGEDAEADAQADIRAAERQAGGAESRGVQITPASITGVARGGQQDKVTAAQARQLMVLYQDLELTPESFAMRIDQYLGDALTLDPEGDVSAQLNRYVKGLSSDDAGKLISSLVDEKDRLNGPPVETDRDAADG